MEEEKFLVELTEEQISTLDVFLLITTNYRKKELEACERLSRRLDEEGNIRYPDMKSNAQYWKKQSEIIEEVQKAINKAMTTPRRVIEMRYRSEQRDVSDPVKNDEFGKTRELLGISGGDSEAYRMRTVIVDVIANITNKEYLRDINHLAMSAFYKQKFQE